MDGASTAVSRMKHCMLMRTAASCAPIGYCVGEVFSITVFRVIGFFRFFGSETAQLYANKPEFD